IKFSVAPKSRRAGVSVLLCAAWTYALRFIDFLLDIYTLSDVFLSHAVWTRCVSVSSFCDAGCWVLTLSSSLSSSFSGSSVWHGVLLLVNSSFGKSKVTVFNGCVDGSVVGLVSLSSNSSEPHKVSLCLRR